MAETRKAASRNKPARGPTILRSVVVNVIIFLVGLIIMSAAAEAKQLTLMREVIIKDELTGAVLNPNAITHADDGGYIIAGRINPTQQAWATKTDAEGKVLWRYQIAVQDKLPIGQGAEFNGVAAMADGSAYLCGRMPHAPGVYGPGLLVHLNATGQVISERLLVPQKRAAAGSAYFYDCVRWHDGIAIVGSIRQFPGLGQDESFYWLLALDAAGNMKWESLVRTTFDAIDEVGQLCVVADDSLVFSGRRLGDKTELIRVNPSGGLEVHKKLAGQFRLIHPVSNDGLLQAFGYAASGKSTTITLDDRLEELGRTEGSYPDNFHPRLIYRLPNQSFALFGSAIRAGGAQFTSRIIHVDPALQSGQVLELAHEPFHDSGYVKVAVPTGKEGEFVTVRNLYTLIPSDETRGAVLDFIQIK